MQDAGMQSIRSLHGSVETIQKQMSDMNQDANKGDASILECSMLRAIVDSMQTQIKELQMNISATRSSKDDACNDSGGGMGEQGTQLADNSPQPSSNAPTPSMAGSTCMSPEAVVFP